MAAVDHANRTGNYAVLRGLGTPGFQTNNSPEALARIFGQIRQQRLNLSDTLLVEPLYEMAPAVQGNLLRLRGAFRMRPTSIQFDLLYQWAGEWKLFGIALNPVPMAR